MTDQARIIPQVELVAIVQDGGGTIPATILIEGVAPLWALSSFAMKAIALQHPHLGGKPIVALRYDVRARP
jgi:hypothetical protein